MAAIFDSKNPASPLAYSASQTALLLLDFQGFTIRLCNNGQQAAAKAAELRNWALSKNIMVVHSIINAAGSPPKHIKGYERVKTMLAGIQDDKAAIEEPAELAATSQPGEHVVLKQPGVVSGLKSDGCEKLLADNNVKSLIICGLSTSGAVLRTTAPATDDGFVVSVIQDACSDRGDELHDTLMKNVLPSRAHITTAAAFIEEWEKKQATQQA